MSRFTQDSQYAIRTLGSVCNFYSVPNYELVFQIDTGKHFWFAETFDTSTIATISDNKVRIWDNRQQRHTKLLLFIQSVEAVKMSANRIAVVLPQKIWLYDLADFSKVSSFETNRALCALSNISFCCTTNKRGEVRVMFTNGTRVTKENHVTDGNYLTNGTRVNDISAHKNEIGCLALSKDGHTLATTSTSGRVIHTFDVKYGSLLRTFRVGYIPRTIGCIVFRWDSVFIACCTSKGQISVFDTTSQKSTSCLKNAKFKRLRQCELAFW